MEATIGTLQQAIDWQSRGAVALLHPQQTLLEESWCVSTVREYRFPKPEEPRKVWDALLNVDELTVGVR